MLQLLGGLCGFGAGVALLVRARFGLDPWDVLSQGIARELHVEMGWVVDAVGAVVLMAWVPLRQRPGFGTLCNVVVIGLVANAVLSALPAPHSLVFRMAALAGGIFLIGTSSGLYIGAGFGPGPRDGLMTGIAARGHSIRVVRTALELSVLIVGWAIGGSVGVGTLLYAVTIGPIVHMSLRRFRHGGGDIPAASTEAVGTQAADLPAGR